MAVFLMANLTTKTKLTETLCNDLPQPPGSPKLRMTLYWPLWNLSPVLQVCREQLLSQACSCLRGTFGITDTISLKLASF